MREVAFREEGTTAVEAAILDWVVFLLGTIGLIRVSFGPVPGPQAEPDVYQWWLTAGLPMAAAVATAGVVSLTLLSRRRGTGYPARLGWWLVAPTGLLSLAALFPAYYVVGWSLERGGMLIDSNGFWRPETLFLWVTLPGILLGLVIVWAGKRTEGRIEKAGNDNSTWAGMSGSESYTVLPSADGGERGLLN